MDAPIVVDFDFSIWVYPHVVVTAWLSLYILPRARALTDYFWRRQQNSEVLNWLSRLPLNKNVCHKVDPLFLSPTFSFLVSFMRLDFKE